MKKTNNTKAKTANKITEEITKETKKPILINKIKFIDSGATLLNLVLGGGYPIGRIVNVVGDKSSGKTLLALEAIIKAKRGNKNLKLFYDDCESGFSFDEETMFGVKVIEEDQKNSETIEEWHFNLDKELDKLKAKDELIYVVDSLDGLSSEAERERAEEEKKARQKAVETGKKVKAAGTYSMEKQKKLSEIFRLLNQKIKNKNCLNIIISQIRMNIGVMFGEKHTRTGGKALDFYASQVTWLSEVEKIKRCDVPVGIRIKVKNKKNKVGKPFRECFLDILFDIGIDNITSNINYLYEMLTNLGKYSPKKIEWDGKEYTPAGLVRYIEENNLESELEKRVIEKWNILENKISSSDRKRKW